LKILLVTPLCSFYPTNGFLDQKAVDWTVAQSCSALKLRVRVSPKRDRLAVRFHPRHSGFVVSGLAEQTKPLSRKAENTQK
jgi:hypothetical protein